MNIEVQPLGNEYRFNGKESGIVEVFETLSGLSLRIIVSTWTDSINEALLQVYFRRPHAYRYLDELDLIAYWKTEKFRSQHHVYEITNGGWLTGEPLLPDMLDSARHTGVREWFICTRQKLAAKIPVRACQEGQSHYADLAGQTIPGSKR